MIYIICTYNKTHYKSCVIAKKPFITKLLCYYFNDTNNECMINTKRMTKYVFLQATIHKNLV